jgi:hypothetical protein
LFLIGKQSLDGVEVVPVEREPEQRLDTAVMVYAAHVRSELEAPGFLLIAVIRARECAHEQRQPVV